MARSLKWELVDRKVLLKDDWICLEASTCRLGDGRVIEPYYVNRLKDFVVIVPVTADGDVILVRQYRHGIEQVLLELPAGVIEDGEAPEKAALRELREETGYEPGPESAPMEFLFKIAPNASNCSCFAWCYLATNVVKTGGQQLDETEELEVVRMPLAEVRKALEAGVFLQAVHVAALYRGLEEVEKEELFAAIEKSSKSIVDEGEG